jgi:hypothetical protein
MKECGEMKRYGKAGNFDFSVQGCSFLENGTLVEPWALFKEKRV